VTHLHAVSELLHARAFALGLAFGGVAFLASALIALSSRRRSPNLAGAAFVAATWLGVRGAWGPSLATSRVALGLAVLWLGGALAGVVITRSSTVGSHPLLTMMIAATPGAVILAAVTPLAGSHLSRVVLGLATVALAVAMFDFNAVRGAKGAPWLLFFVSAVGVYLAVPDTELARVFLGVAIPFVLLSVPKPLCPFGASGSAALAGLFTWVVVVGGRGRPGSVVGGLAAIGILVAEPIGRRLVGEIRIFARQPSVNPRYDRNRDAWLSGALVAALVQLGIVLYASRLVAREDRATTALFILLPMMVAAVALTPALYAEERRPARRRRDPIPRPAMRYRSRY
jgi:hypothetical protein